MNGKLKKSAAAQSPCSGTVGRSPRETGGGVVSTGDIIEGKNSRKSQVHFLIIPPIFLIVKSLANISAIIFCITRQNIRAIWKEFLRLPHCTGRAEACCSYSDMRLKRFQLPVKTGEISMKKYATVFCMAALVMLLAATGGFAQRVLPASCTSSGGTYVVVPPSATPATSTLIIAAAANFYGAAQDLAADLIAANPAVTSVTVCSNASGTFAPDITGGADFDFFFAANDEWAYEVDDYFNNPLYDAFLYANGIPVLFGWTNAPNPNLTATVGNTITDVSSLLVDTSNPPQNFTDVLAYNVSGSATNLRINTNITSPPTPNANVVAYADPDVAPYGQRAVAIMTDMGIDVNNPSPVVLSMHTGDTVGTAFNSVGAANGTVFSGFVSKAQICPHLPIVAYAQFTSYVLPQWAIQIKPAGDPLKSYIDTLKANTLPNYRWDDFLVGHCYGALNP